jgi:polar amino acid transport system substrate-binding protein
MVKSKNILKKIPQMLGAFATVLLLVIGVSACGDNNDGSQAGSDHARTVQEIKDSGKVKIGVFSDKAPFGYTDAAGNYAGYDVVFANRIAKDLGVEVEFVPTEAAARVSSLESKRVDIVLANFTVTAERAEKVDFALPYMRVALGVVSPQNAPITSLQDYSSQTSLPLIVVKGTTAETYLEKQFPNIELLKYEQYNDAQQALLDGRGGAWITDNTEAIAFAKNSPNFVVPEAVANVGDKDTIAPAVTRGNTGLLNWLNDEIVSLASEKFFHKDYEETLKDTYGTEYEEVLVVEGGAA